MEKTKVSIITVCYNSEGVLRKTIESVLGQTYDNIEYIIIDGKSEDQSLEVAQSYQEDFDKFGYEYYILSEPDHGIYDAMNKGIRMAAGELVGLINSGDWYEPQAVQRMIDIYHTQPFDLFYADLRLWKRSGTMIKKAKFRTYATTRDWNHPTTFIRRKIYDEYQYACRCVYDDWDLVLRLRNAGCRIVVLNEILANFVFGGVSNQKSLKMAWHRGRDRYRIYRENEYGRWYLIECIIMEVTKYLMA